MHRLLLLLFYSLRVFHTSISWWSLTGVSVITSPLDSSQYFDWFQQCCVDSPSDFLFFQYFFWALIHCSNRTNFTVTSTFTYYQRHLYVSRFWQDPIFFLFFAFFYFHSAKSTRWQVLFYLLINTRSDLLAGTRWSVCVICSSTAS